MGLPEEPHRMGRGEKIAISSKISFPPEIMTSISPLKVMLPPEDYTLFHSSSRRHIGQTIQKYLLDFKRLSVPQKVIRVHHQDSILCIKRAWGMGSYHDFLK